MSERSSDRYADHDTRHLDGGEPGLAASGYDAPLPDDADARIQALLSERFVEDDHIHPAAVNVAVRGGVVTLDGCVEQRWIKYRLEDMVEACAGVRCIVNRLRVERTGAAMG